MKITLASTSRVRSRLLSAAGVDFEVQDSRFDEEKLKQALLRNKTSPKKIAMALAQAKASNICSADDGLVIGCDQVLVHQDMLVSKPQTKDEARVQLLKLRAQTHLLISASVICEKQVPVWSCARQVELTMRDFSDDYLEQYLIRNWPSIQSSVGGYKLEEEGVRLFSKIRGDHFTVLGIPLLEILEYLGQRGAIHI